MHVYSARSQVDIQTIMQTMPDAIRSAARQASTA
jgi:hypothetical protein